MAATVRGWVGEFRQNRPVRYQEIKRQLGWSEVEGSGPARLAAGAARQGEE